MLRETLMCINYIITFPLSQLCVSSSCENVALKRFLEYFIALSERMGIIPRVCLREMRWCYMMQYRALNLNDFPNFYDSLCV